ncbi:MAG: type I phosphomannose isomerase catalytic subunit [Acetivibrionales bacterium]
MLYPLKFKPLYKDYVWGGRNLASLGKKLPPSGIVAESWEIACHKNGTSIVANGEYEGMSLADLIMRYGRKIIGNALPDKDIEKFPLLVKFIDAENNLSVQVHPDDAFVQTYENGEYGKNEMWYIISAKPGARLVYDVVPGTTREKFAETIEKNNVESCLKSIQVFPGDVINIPAGIVHAIGKGIILAEIQQNSDTTYRIYDYGRTGRELHIEKALQVIDFKSEGRKEKYRGIELSLGAGCSKKTVVANQYFCTEIYDININGEIHEIADGSRFYIYVLISGSGTIAWNGGKTGVKTGDSVLVPAALGEYSLSGNFTALKTYVPNLFIDVVQPLLDSGKTPGEIASEIGGLEAAIKL